MNWRHTFLGVTLAADLLYIGLIVSGVAIAGHERMLAPQLSQITVGALAATTVIAVGMVLTDRIMTRLDIAVAVVGGISAKVEDELAELRKQLGDQPNGRPTRDPDQTTRDLARAAGPPRQIVYAGVAALRAGGDGFSALDGAVDQIFERVDRYVDERVAAFKEQVEEYGRQKWFAGYSRREEDDADGVTPLQPRNGSRPAR